MINSNHDEYNCIMLVVMGSLVIRKSHEVDTNRNLDINQSDNGRVMDDGIKQNAGNVKGIVLSELLRSKIISELLRSKIIA